MIITLKLVYLYHKNQNYLLFHLEFYQYFKVDFLY